MYEAIDQSPAAKAARLAVAAISGIASRHASHAARWAHPTEEEIAAAVAELRDGGYDRPDLLAEWAGIMLGTAPGAHDEPLRRAQAAICIAAGADEWMLDWWTGVGMERAEEAGRRFPGGAGVAG